MLLAKRSISSAKNEVFLFLFKQNHCQAFSSLSCNVSPSRSNAELLPKNSFQEQLRRPFHVTVVNRDLEAGLRALGAGVATSAIIGPVSSGSWHFCATILTAGLASVSLLRAVDEFEKVKNPKNKIILHTTSINAVKGILPDGIGIGIIFGNFLSSTARNPSLANKLFGNAIVGAAFCESLGLFALAVAFLLLS